MAALDGWRSVGDHCDAGSRRRVGRRLTASAGAEGLVEVRGRVSNLTGQLERLREIIAVIGTV